MGSFPRMIQEKLIELCKPARREPAFQTMLLEHCDAMRAGLLAETQQTMLEMMLVERIVTCWLAAYLSDVDVSWHMGEFDMPYFVRRQDNAHKQFLRAVESLAKVQRLMRPGPLLALAQMNIATPGSQQVNMVTPGVSTPLAAHPLSSADTTGRP
jgi:hypothetical protein